jgi:hypothetical protein
LRFLLDNNLPPPLARALHELSKKDGHAVEHLRDKFPANTDDVTWINILREEDDWAIISQDRFRKGQLEAKAIRESGLPVFCLAKHWTGESYWEKAHNLVRWWPSIIQQAELISGGAAFKVPWKFSFKGKFEQIRF